MRAQPKDKDHPDHVGVILKNRVPEVNLVFWIIKILSTTVGESFSDFLSDTAGLGLPVTTGIMFALLILALAGEFFTSRYNAFVYWLVVVLFSIVGTCITDNLHDGLGLENWVMSIVWAVVLLIVFGAWYYKEGTLNFHSIFTRSREAFYWVCVLIAFALGTAFGDLLTEGVGLGYKIGVGLFGGLILLTTAIWYFTPVSGVLCFWVAYILTRPFGASLGDLLADDPDAGGLGLGYKTISIIFFSLILVLVIYLQVMISRERKRLEGAAAENGGAKDDAEGDDLDLEASKDLQVSDGEEGP
jgi:uncharacterized membrane-anchored protein